MLDVSNFISNHTKDIYEKCSPYLPIPSCIEYILKLYNNDMVFEKYDQSALREMIISLENNQLSYDDLIRNASKQEIDLFIASKRRLEREIESIKKSLMRINSNLKEEFEQNGQALLDAAKNNIFIASNDFIPMLQSFIQKQANSLKLEMDILTNGQPEFITDSIDNVLMFSNDFLLRKTTSRLDIINKEYTQEELLNKIEALEAYKTELLETINDIQKTNASLKIELNERSNLLSEFIEKCNRYIKTIDEIQQENQLYKTKQNELLESSSEAQKKLLEYERLITNLPNIDELITKVKYLEEINAKQIEEHENAINETYVSLETNHLEKIRNFKNAVSILSKTNNDLIQYFIYFTTELYKLLSIDDVPKINNEVSNIETLGQEILTNVSEKFNSLLIEKDTQLNELKSILAKEDEKIEQQKILYETTLTKLQDRISMLENELKEYKLLIESTNNEIASKTNELEIREKDVDRLKLEINKEREIMAELKEQIQQQEHQFIEIERINQLEEMLEKKERELLNQISMANLKEVQLIELSNVLDEKNETIESLNDELKRVNTALDETNKHKITLEQQLLVLEKKEQELEDLRTQVKINQEELSAKNLELNRQLIGCRQDVSLKGLELEQNKELLEQHRTQLEKQTADLIKTKAQLMQKNEDFIDRLQHNIDTTTKIRDKNRSRKESEIKSKRTNEQDKFRIIE